MYQYNVDLSTFEEIPRHLSYYDRPRLSVSAKGYVSFNSALMHLVGKQREFCVCCGPDGRFLALYTGKAPNFILPALLPNFHFDFIPNRTYSANRFKFRLGPSDGQNGG